MFKKLLLTTTLIAGFSSAALAHPHGPTITLGGHIDTQLGYVDQDTNYDKIGAVAAGAKLHEFSLVNDTKLHIKVDGKTQGLKYGGKVVINADTSNNKTNHGGTSTFSNSVGYTAMGYVETVMGRLEAGTTTGVADAMKINAGSVARATGGVDGDWEYWINPIINSASAAGFRAVDANFILTPNLPTNVDKGGEDKAAKLTYYTPMWNGFKAGVTYVPDTEQHGTVAQTHVTGKVFDLATSDTFLNGAYKDVFSGGIHYHMRMGNMKIGLSALGETGRSKNVAPTATRDDLKAYEFGAKVQLMGATLAGSYGDWDKSGTLKTVAGVPVGGKRNASYWNVGAGYEYDGWGISIGYFESEKGNGNGNTSRAELNNISVGMDYKLAPGFMPYAEVNFFDMDDKSTPVGKNSGVVLLAGTKLVF